MKRVLALAVAALLFAATPVLAQSGPGDTTRRTAMSREAGVDFSPRAARIGAMASARASRSDARRAPAAPQAQRRSFWKTPWPYVIIGGVVAAGIIIASGDGDGIY